MLTEPVPQSASTPRRPLAEHITAVLDAIADGVTVQDAAGHVIYANAAAAVLLGVSSAAELVAAEPSSVVARFDMLDEQGAALSPHELPGRHVLAGADTREQLILFRVHETKVERWSLVRANVMRGPSGERWVVNTFRDVTDSVQTRRRLEASELRYAQILDSVQDMVFTKSRDYVVTYANRAACEHYGMSADELRGVTDVPFNQRDFTEQYLADDREVLERGKVIEQREEPNIRHDGKARVFHTIKAPIRDPQGNVVELVGVARDITEQRATQASSQAYQRRLELALAAGHMGVFEWDLVKNRVMWSPEVERMHGIAVGSFDGTFDAYQRDIHPDDRSHVLATVRHTMEKHDPHYLTYRIIRPDGAVR